MVFVVMVVLVIAVSLALGLAVALAVTTAASRRNGQVDDAALERALAALREQASARS